MALAEALNRCCQCLPGVPPQRLVLVILPRHTNPFLSTLLARCLQLPSCLHWPPSSLPVLLTAHGSTMPWRPDAFVCKVSATMAPANVRLIVEQKSKSIQNRHAENACSSRFAKRKELWCSSCDKMHRTLSVLNNLIIGGASGRVRATDKNRTKNTWVFALTTETHLQSVVPSDLIGVTNDYCVGFVTRCTAAKMCRTWHSRAWRFRACTAKQVLRIVFPKWVHELTMCRSLWGCLGVVM